MLGHDQPRDSHVHGAPHARAEPSAQLMQYERAVCARRTATKYRNSTTATRHPAGLRAALACSVASMVAFAGSSGRRDFTWHPKSHVFAFGVLARPYRSQASAERQSMLETLPVSLQILSELTPPILRSKAINLRISFGDSA